jgi:hypothetical protein
MVAFGVCQWPLESSGSFGDWKPLLLVFVSLLLLRFLVQLEIGWPTGLTAVGMGTVWGWMIDWWGIFVPTALVLFVVLFASSAVDRIRRTPA